MRSTPPSRDSNLPPPVRVLDFEHHRGGQLVALRDHRVIGRKLVRELRLAALLDAQHLLHLQPHRVVVLEIERGVGAYGNAPVGFDLADGAALFVADALVGFERKNIGGGDFVLHRVSLTKP